MENRTTISQSFMTRVLWSVCRNLKAIDQRALWKNWWIFDRRHRQSRSFIWRWKQRSLTEPEVKQRKKPERWRQFCHVTCKRLGTSSPAEPEVTLRIEAWEVGGRVKLVLLEASKPIQYFHSHQFRDSSLLLLTYHVQCYKALERDGHTIQGTWGEG